MGAKVTRQVNKQAAQGLRAITNPDNAVGKVGWFESARYPNGVPVALVAAVNEYGWPEHNIPPRLGMRATADALRPIWAQITAQVAKRVVDGKMTWAAALEIIGAKAAGDIRKHISEVTTPPLKVDTVKARLAGKRQGNVVAVTIAKPLVHTGHLLNTCTNVVEQKP